MITQLDQLRNCVSVLFAFERKPLSNAQFRAQLRVWIDQLLTHLFRVSTLRDHLFVLNHVLRCPAGVGEWASKYIQLLSPMIVSIREQPFECLASGSYPENFSPGLLFRLVPPASGLRDVSPGFLRDDSAAFSWGGSPIGSFANDACYIVAACEAEERDPRRTWSRFDAHSWR